MGDVTRMDVKKLLSTGKDLINLLESDGDINTLKQCLQQCQALQSQSDADFKEVECSIQEYQNKLDSSRRRTAEAKLELVVYEDSKSEAQELEEASQREHLLREELSTLIAAEIDNLEQQSVSIEAQRHALRKLEQEDLKKEMGLSMYASVTSIIPNLDDQSTISGHIVEGEKKAVQKFEVEPAKQTSFDACSSIWKMISS